MAKKSEKAEKQQDKKAEKQEEIRKEELKDQATEEAAEEKEEEAADKESAEASDEGEKNEPTAEEKLAELQDKYLRLSAEYDNYRRRSLNEKIDLQKSANVKLLGALLPVADDFDRALQAMAGASDLDALREGMELIAGKFRDFLSQQGVKEIEAKEKDFDTDMHEAITKIPAPSKKLKGKVVDVVTKGYYLNDKVLRYSQVVIGE